MENNTEKKVCTRCKLEKLITVFQKGRKGTSREYMFSYCNTCRYEQVNERHENNFESYLKLIIGQARRRNKNIPHNIDSKYMLEIYNVQKGKCLYTNEILDYKLGKGKQRNTLSIDKIVPKLGYVKGNVAFCSMRANAIKSDLTLEELKQWIPKWYSKLQKADFVTVVN